MIERLARALEHLEELPVDVQEGLAEQIEQYRRVPAHGAQPARRSFAGIGQDLPDDMEEILLRWRHETPPMPPAE